MRGLSLIAEGGTDPSTARETRGLSLIAEGGTDPSTAERD
jgi:hypothetical protein